MDLEPIWFTVLSVKIGAMLSTTITYSCILIMHILSCTIHAQAQMITIHVAIAAELYYSSTRDKHTLVCHTTHAQHNRLIS